MSLELSWADLITEDLDRGEAQRILRGWARLVSGPVAPVFLSKFGDWFLRRPGGQVQKLDVLRGDLATLAASPEEFRGRVNSRDWQEEHLVSPLVYSLHEQGKVPGPGQCYAVAPHPIFGGRLEPRFIAVADIPVRQSICN